VIEDFIGIKSRRNFLERIKQKIDIFKRIKTYLTLKKIMRKR